MIKETLSINMVKLQTGGHNHERLEEEIHNRDLMAPCGLYCGACGIYIATRDENEKFKAVMGRVYGTKPEETECCGCMQPEPPKKRYGYCQQCKIRSWVKSKDYYSCHQCDEWPCDQIENFGYATGVRVAKRAIPLWRAEVAKHGDEKGSVNGHGLNVNAITALPAVNRFSEVRRLVVFASRRLPKDWMDPSELFLKKESSDTKFLVS